MNQGYFNNRIQVIHNKGKAIIIPKRGMLLNSKAPPIPTSPMTRINRVILKENPLLSLLSIHELRYFMAELVAVNPIYIIRFVKERMEV